MLTGRVAASATYVCALPAVCVLCSHQSTIHFRGINRHMCPHPLADSLVASLFRFIANLFLLLLLLY
uniref:Putative secreted peptide n=1 Tax=Anopheles braziliensis TaxID=58242 RepID=A0A2M3ZRM4_9DIPT